MTLLPQKMHLINIAFSICISILLIACTDKSDNVSKEASIVSPVSEDKIAQLEREAQAGDPDAQYNLAYMHENGLGLPKNEAKALELYQSAADKGHSDAQINLEAMRSSK